MNATSTRCFLEISKIIRLDGHSYVDQVAEHKERCCTGRICVLDFGFPTTHRCENLAVFDKHMSAAFHAPAFRLGWPAESTNPWRSSHMPNGKASLLHRRHRDPALGWRVLGRCCRYSIAASVLTLASCSYLYGRPSTTRTRGANNVHLMYGQIENGVQDRHKALKCHTKRFNKTREP